MDASIQSKLQQDLEQIKASGLYKAERVLTSPQSAHVGVAGGREVLNMCANNYLGLSSHPEIVAAAKEALDTWGYGLSSVRFICGTQQIHKDLEDTVSRFLQTDDTSCFDANTGLFETLLGPEDAIISDELNHASIIGFFYPVVPMGQARTRVQISAAHTREDLTFVMEQFRQVKSEINR